MGSRNRKQRRNRPNPKRRSRPKRRNRAQNQNQNRNPKVLLVQAQALSQSRHQALPARQVLASSSCSQPAMGYAPSSARRSFDQVKAYERDCTHFSELSF